MSIGFINMSGAFAPTLPSGINGSGVGIAENLSQNITGGAGKIDWNGMWLMATGITALGAIGIAYLTRTTNMIGVYLFGTFFWSSWLNVIRILNDTSFLSFPGGLALIGMISVGMTFMFIGAVIGLLSGSIWMR
jgi:hypothetical protein